MLLQCPCIVTDLPVFITHAGPAVPPAPARSSPSASRNPGPTLCEVQWQSVAGLLQVTSVLETVRDQRRFQCETKMTNMSSDESQMWVSAPSCFHPPHVHLPFPAAGQAGFRHQTPDTELRALHKLYGSHHLVSFNPSNKSLI